MRLSGVAHKSFVCRWCLYQTRLQACSHSALDGAIDKLTARKEPLVGSVVSELHLKTANLQNPRYSFVLSRASKFVIFCVRQRRINTLRAYCFSVLIRDLFDSLAGEVVVLLAEAAKDGSAGIHSAELLAEGIFYFHCGGVMLESRGDVAQGICDLGKL